MLPAAGMMMSDVCIQLPVLSCQSLVHWHPLPSNCSDELLADIPCACSDSEGAIWLYDVNTQQLVSEYEAHTKRVWALDFAPAVASSSGAGSSASVLGPSGHVFASGSDDYTVKVGHGMTTSTTIIIIAAAPQVSN